MNSKEMSLVSIIVPVYNVEKYIDGCMKSIIRQTYQPLEVVIVDDCGPDASMEIVAETVRKYDGPIQFKILRHEFNRGVSAARNTGMDASVGDYVFFLDSDDMISDDCIQKLMEALHQEPDADMAIGQLDVIGESTPFFHDRAAGVFTHEIINMAYSKWIYPMACNRLIKKDFLIKNNLYFVEGLCHEDELWSMTTAINMKKCVIIEAHTYKYVVHENSLQTCKSQAFHLKNYINVNLLFLQYVSEHSTFDNINLYLFFQDCSDRFIWSRIGVDDSLLRDYYYQFRDLPSWRLSQIKQFRKITLAMWLRELHRIMPKALGFRYYYFFKKRRVKKMGWL